MRVRQKLVVPILITLLFIIITVTTHPVTSFSGAWMQSVDPWVLETAVRDENVEFIVLLAEQADLGNMTGLLTKQQKGDFVYKQLTEVANRSQAELIDILRSAGVEFQPFWIANMIWVHGNFDTVQTMATHSEVGHIYANPAVSLTMPGPEPVRDIFGNIEPNLILVNADEVWAAGFYGEGAVIGGQDTGYDWTHPALIDQYRGWNGTSADHNFNWHDAIHDIGGGNCGSDSSEPCDDLEHGTHTMGIMVGDDGGDNKIGMAPGATWIGCRNMDRGVGTPATYSECYQWFVAPTDLQNQNADPSKAPHVINNSWSCPPSEGCTNPTILKIVVDNVRAAGILTTHAAGNSGSSCGTINTAAAIYDSSFTVGAITLDDQIAHLSSRGPVTVDASERLKPDVTAPGIGIRSSIPGERYGILSGTSMAAPHVAGLVALLISANPLLEGSVDTLESIIKLSAVPRVTSQICGGVSGYQVPNNTYGYGRIDSLSAIQWTGLSRWYFPIIEQTIMD